MNRMILACVVLATLGRPSHVWAQTEVEVGTKAGLTMLRRGGNTLTYVGIPGQGIQALPSIYASILTGGHLFVQPELVFTRISSSGSSVTSIGVLGNVGYLLTPSAPSSLYASAGLAYEHVSATSQSLDGPAIGAAIGYRFKVKKSLGIRVEGSFRRWSSDFEGLSEFGLGVRLGAIVE